MIKLTDQKGAKTLRVPPLYCPNFYRNINKESLGPMKARSEYRDKFRKIARDFSKQYFHTSSKLHFLKMFSTVASLPQSQQLLKELTVKSLKYAKRTLQHCHQQFSNLKKDSQLQNITKILSLRQEQINMIQQMCQLLQYLCFDYYEVERSRIHYHFQKLYKINRYTKKQRQVIDQLLDSYKKSLASKQAQKQIRINQAIQLFYNQSFIKNGAQY